MSEVKKIRCFMKRDLLVKWKRTAIHKQQSFLLPWKLCSFINNVLIETDTGTNCLRLDLWSKT